MRAHYTHIWRQHSAGVARAGASDTDGGACVDVRGGAALRHCILAGAQRSKWWRRALSFLRAAPRSSGAAQLRSAGHVSIAAS